MNINELNTFEQIQKFVESKINEKSALMESLSEIQTEIQKKIQAKEKALDEKNHAKMESLPDKKKFTQLVKDCSILEAELSALKKELDSCQTKIELPNDLLSEEEFNILADKLRLVSAEWHDEYRQKEKDLLLQVEELDKEEQAKQNELDFIYSQMKTLHDFKNEYITPSITYGNGLEKNSFSQLMQYMR